MTDLDLTEAVDAAAQALFRHQYPDVRGTWDDVMPMTKHTLREIVLPVVSAAAPLITAQVRAECGRWTAVQDDVDSPCIRPAGHTSECHPEVHAATEEADRG